MVYRRFGFLQARLLLENQSELSRLERKLEQDDWSVHDAGQEGLRSSRGYTAEKTQLLAEIQQKWLRYSKSIHLSGSLGP